MDDFKDAAEDTVPQVHLHDPFHNTMKGPSPQQASTPARQHPAATTPCRWEVLQTAHLCLWQLQMCAYLLVGSAGNTLATLMGTTLYLANFDKDPSVHSHFLSTFLFQAN